MKCPSLPENEKSRLKNLQSLEILDSGPEIAYDELTKLASSICEVPIALVSLVDADRQWFKSRVGLQTSETPRDISFCGHAIQGSEIFQIEDARLDPRFQDNPLVTGEPHIVFYAGYPLESAEGFKLGTLCVIDHKPRSLSSNQKSALETLGRQVSALLNLRKSNAQLRESLRELEEKKELLRHKEKMASLGEMMGGIAHELNNPLAIIQGYTQSLLGKMSSFQSNPDVLKKLEAIRDQTHRAVKVIQSMVNLSAPTPSRNLTAVPVLECLRDILDLFEEKCRARSIQLDWNIPPEIVSKATAEDLRQVLSNLLNNAIDAVNDQEIKWIRVSAYLEREKICLSVEDSGPGVHPELQKKIFQPFFTTKEPGKGTGLGLSICHNLMESLGGEIVVDPRVNTGSRFIISLPLSPL